MLCRPLRDETFFLKPSVGNETLLLALRLRYEALLLALCLLTLALILGLQRFDRILSLSSFPLTRSSRFLSSAFSRAMPSCQDESELTEPRFDVARALARRSRSSMHHPPCEKA